MPLSSQTRSVAVWWCRVVVAAWVVSGGGAASRGADPAPSGTELRPPNPMELVLTSSAQLRQDRARQQLLVMARDSAAAGQFSEAASTLQQVLDEPQDGWTGGAQVFVSQRAEANRLLSTLPAPVRQAYVTQYAAAATRLLDEAQASPALWGEVAIRYYHTDAGRSALQELAAWHFDRGDVELAGLALERAAAHPRTSAALRPLLIVKAISAWQRAGDNRRAESLRQQHAGLLAGATVQLGGRKADPAKWLASMRPLQPVRYQPPTPPMSSPRRRPRGAMAPRTMTSRPGCSWRPWPRHGSGGRPCSPRGPRWQWGR